MKLFCRCDCSSRKKIEELEEKLSLHRRTIDLDHYIGTIEMRVIDRLANNPPKNIIQSIVEGINRLQLRDK